MTRKIPGTMCIPNDVGEIDWMENMDTARLCACGCGQATQRSYSHGKKTGPHREYIFGHYKPKPGHGNVHGLSHSAEYAAYYDAKKRCTPGKTTQWERYGGRGIQFRFTSFQQFIEHIGRKPTPEHSLDRIHNDGHYEVGNVRWATTAEQAANRKQRGAAA